MRIRLRRLSEEELEQAAYDGTPLVIPMCWAKHPDEVTYVVMECQYGEGSAEGPSWSPMEVE